MLVAVERALESAPPSGRGSVKHVQNVLARLNDPPTPEPVMTTITIATPPLADPARYDRLREVEHA